MAYNANNIYAPGLLAGASLATSQFRPVKLASTAGEVVAATAAADEIIGVLHNEPADGDAAHVAIGGVSKFLCGTAAGCAAGTYLTANSTGWRATALANTSIGGYCIEGVSNKNEVGTMIVLGGGLKL